MIKTLIFLCLGLATFVPGQGQAVTKTPDAATASLASTELVPEYIWSSARLARITAYWVGEGDHYSNRAISATGLHLYSGDCAVDPGIIPYGSIVTIAGVGTFLAVDTGTAVVTRRAAREAAHSNEERHALVIDLFFDSRKAAQTYLAGAPKYAQISWGTSSLPSTPSATPTPMPLRMGLPLQPLRSEVKVATQ